MVWADEVGVAAGCLRNPGVVGEFAPVVIGDGVEEFGESAGDAARRVGRLSLGLSRDAPREQQPRLALGEGHEAAPVAASDHGVSLPVAEPGALLHLVGALGDVHPAWDPAPEVVLSVALAALVRRVPQVGVQVSAPALVAPHHLVDGLVRHPRVALHSHAPGYLLGTPVRVQLLDHLGPHLLRQPNASPTGGMPPVGEALRLLRTVSPQPGVPLQLPTHRRW